MVKDYQLDPVKGKLIHTDLRPDRDGPAAGGLRQRRARGRGRGREGGRACWTSSRARSTWNACRPISRTRSRWTWVISRSTTTSGSRTSSSNSKIKVLTDPEVVIVTISPPLKEERAGRGRSCRGCRARGDQEGQGDRGRRRGGGRRRNSADPAANHEPQTGSGTRQSRRALCRDAAQRRIHGCRRAGRAERTRGPGRSAAGRWSAKRRSSGHGVCWPSR